MTKHNYSSQQHKIILRYYGKEYSKLVAFCGHILSPYHNTKENNEDALQDAIIKAISALRRGDRPEELIPWFKRILTNICLDKLRKMKSSVSKDKHTDELQEENKLPEELSYTPNFIEDMTSSRLFYHHSEKYVHVKIYSKIRNSLLFDDVDKTIFYYRFKNIPYDIIRKILGVNSNNFYKQKDNFYTNLKSYLNDLDYNSMLSEESRQFNSFIKPYSQNSYS